jgi:hypothetical protein
MSTLEEEYLADISYNYPLFKKVREGVYNCRCPYCGDSAKSIHAKHGYFYTRHGKLFYKCHKGCTSTTFESILKKEYPEIYTRFKLDKFKNGNRYKLTVSKPLTSSSVKEELFIPISSLQDTHPAIKYLTSRKVPPEKWNRLYYTNSIKKIAAKLSKYQDVNFQDGDYIVFKFIRNNSLTHIGFRNIHPSSFRYTTLELSETDKIFGLDVVKFDRQIKVVEGQFDSLFLDNCIAMSGLSCNFEILKSHDAVFIFDKEPRNKFLIQAIEKAIESGFAVCMMDDRFIGKDINDYVINGASVQEIESYIKVFQKKGLRAEMELNRFKRV